jgi:hypothetical protein
VADSGHDEVVPADRHAHGEPYRRQVEALRCLRGVEVLAAPPLLCEIDHGRRFASPMALFVGAVSSAVPRPGDRGTTVNRREESGDWRILVW